jgi:branched-chain amino acid transport system substrate-binding protein
MPRLSLLIAAIFVAVAACACDGSSTASPALTPTALPPSPIEIASSADVVIGVSAALSGDQQNIGRDIADAIDLAVADYGGTLNGHAVRTVRSDDGCTDAQMAAKVAHDFVQNDTLIGVIGPVCTTGAQAANGLYERAGIAHISPSTTRVDLSAQGERYFFRTSWRDDAQAAIQAAYARGGVSAGTAVVVDDGEPYGKGLAEAFSAAFESAGGQIISHERIERGETDFSSLARMVRSADPDVLVFEGLNPEGVLLVRALRTELYGGIFIAPDGVLSVRDFLASAGPAGEGAIVSGGAAPDDAFVAKFRERFQREPTTPFVLQAYDATTVLLKAAEAAAVGGSDGSLRIDREQLAEIIRAQRVEGLTGAIHFDENGDRAGASAGEAGLVIYRVGDGMFLPVR